MAIVLATALFAGTRSEATPTAANGRCRSSSPSSARSAAASRSPSPTARPSKAIRTEVERRIAAGESDGEIRAYFAQTLGDDILLRPPASGWGGLVWVLPVAGLVLAGAGIGSRSGGGDAGHDGVPRSSTRSRSSTNTQSLKERFRSTRTHLATLEEQRRFLQRSLGDLEREHDAGDLDDEDYATLKHDYEARLTAVSRAIEDGRASWSPTGDRRARPARPQSWRGLWCSRCCAASSCPQRRTPRSRQHDHRRHQPDGPRAQHPMPERSTRRPSKAVSCYTSVLADAPQNVEALTYRAGSASSAATRRASPTCSRPCNSTTRIPTCTRSSRSCCSGPAA